MSRATRSAFDRVDRDDPTLAVDDLSEFLPLESDTAVDATLTVSALYDFFEAERTAPPAMDEIHGTSLPSSGDEGLDTGFGNYFSDSKVAPATTYDDRVDDGECVDVAPEDLGFQSEIQRAAMDFQRFAEKFHAFARQCQQHQAAFATALR